MTRVASLLLPSPMADITNQSQNFPPVELEHGQTQHSHFQMIRDDILILNNFLCQSLNHSSEDGRG